MKLVVMDLDGCLFDDTHRYHLYQQQRYDEYHALLSEDPVNGGAELVLKAELEGGADLVLFLTARPEEHRDVTTQQLAELMSDVDPFANWQLVMRPDDDPLTASPALKVRLLREWLLAMPGGRRCHGCVYDDRQDVLQALRIAQQKAWQTTLRFQMLSVREPSPEHVFVKDEATTSTDSVAALLRGMAATYEGRNAVYGDNYKQVGQLTKVLFPDGIPPELLHSDHWHLFELMLVKLSRFAISGLTHQDSIHDAAIYAAMIEHIITQKGN